MTQSPIKIIIDIQDDVITQVLTDNPAGIQIQIVYDDADMIHHSPFAIVDIVEATQEKMKAFIRKTADKHRTELARLTDEELESWGTNREEELARDAEFVKDWETNP